MCVISTILIVGILRIKPRNVWTHRVWVWASCHLAHLHMSVPGTHLWSWNPDNWTLSRQSQICSHHPVIFRRGSQPRHIIIIVTNNDQIKSVLFCIKNEDQNSAFMDSKSLHLPYLALETLERIKHHIVTRKISAFRNGWTPNTHPSIVEMMQMYPHLIILKYLFLNHFQHQQSHF